MKTITAKKEARLEKKKKKSAALAQIIKLNDEDETIKKKYRRLSNDSDDGKNVDSSNKKNKLNNRNSVEKEFESEPKQKRIKLDLIGENYENETNKRNYKRIDLRISPSTSADNHECNDETVYMTERQAKQKRMERHGPKIRLKELGEYALLSTAVENRVPIFLTDIQHLIMSTLIGNKSPFTPTRWFHLEKESKLTHSLVLIVEGISLFHFLTYESNFEQCNKIFNLKLEVVMPPYKEGRVIEQLASIPITSSHREELIKKHGSLQAAVQITRDSSLLMKTLFPIDNEESSHQSIVIPKNDLFPRTKLLLSAIQMVEEGYPLPLNGALANKYRDYVFTKDVYDAVSEHSPMFGLDCEMCRTITGGHELTRISIVDENLQPIYETLVRPTNKIVDYLTQYSGITAEMMLNVTKTLEEVQNEVREILPSDAILVGQSLNSDLHAMRMMHPYVIDTSVIFNLTGERRKKTKLQILAQRFLGEVIQVHDDGHDSLEDSRASMKLAQLKLAHGIDFGDEVLRGKKKSNDLTTANNQAESGDNLLHHAVKHEKRTAVITSQEISSDLERITYKEMHHIKNIKRKSIDHNEKIDDDNDGDKMNPSENIHFYKLGGNKAAIRKTQEILNDYDLTISNLCIPEQRLESSRIEKTIRNVDKWIGKLWESIAYRGLFIVIFGGAPGAPNGVAMIKIKKHNNNSDINNSEMPIIT